jgi:hypothetical protein
LRQATALLAAATAGCMTPAVAPPASPPGLLVYNPAGVTITREQREGTGAILRREGSCLVLDTLGRIKGQRWAPVWPLGTSLGPDGVRLPKGEPVPFGRRLSVEGRLASPGEAWTGGCPSPAFLVQSANRAFVWNSAAELVDGSEEVLVIELFWANFDDPQPDGMLTTLNGTVVELIKGGRRAGSTVRLRLPAGATTRARYAHDPFRGLYPAAAGQRVLLFVDQELYAAQARARGGTPLTGHLGGSSFFRLEGERVINDTDSPAPANLAETRRLAAGS